MTEPLRISTIAEALEGWAPTALAEDYDNVGLLVGDTNLPVTGVLVSLDVTVAIVSEAIDRGCNLIIAHHPVWFRPRKRLTPTDYAARALIKAIKHDVGLYALHTNLDNVLDGVNARIGQKLGLTNLEILTPLPGRLHNGQPVGAGMTGRLPQPVTLDDFCSHVKTAFECQYVRYAAGDGRPIEQVAYCGGSGAFLIGDALRFGADVFLTGDLTYHKFFDGEGRMALVDLDHYDMEQYTVELILAFLQEKFSIFAGQIPMCASALNTNPIKLHA